MDWIAAAIATALFASGHCLLSQDLRPVWLSSESRNANPRIVRMPESVASTTLVEDNNVIKCLARPLALTGVGRVRRPIEEKPARNVSASIDDAIQVLWITDAAANPNADFAMSSRQDPGAKRS